MGVKNLTSILECVSIPPVEHGRLKGLKRIEMVLNFLNIRFIVL